MRKICILGASGFVGRALVERLHKLKYDVVPVIHSPGNAWSILRYDLPLVIGDLTNLDSVNQSIKGCDCVINLSLGKFNEMVVQLQNVIDSCFKNNVKRLIHISSITVYGDNPHPDSKFEMGPVGAKKGSYGWFKMMQDDLIEKANKNGLSSITLCPPHITGAYGRIFHQVVDTIKEGSFVLVEDGSLPCNIVDINNMCRAIELSINIEKTVSGRIFVTNGDTFTWRDLAINAARLADRDFNQIPIVTRDELLKMDDNISLLSLFKKILSSEELKKDAGKTILFRNKLISSAAKRVYSRFKSPRSKPGDVAHLRKKINLPLCKQQLRGVRHEIDKARKVLGYSPIVNSTESFQLFENYYHTLYGYNTEYWELLNR